MEEKDRKKMGGNEEERERKGRRDQERKWRRRIERKWEERRKGNANKEEQVQSNPWMCLRKILMCSKTWLQKRLMKILIVSGWYKHRARGCV